MSTGNPKWKRHLTKVLTILLIFMVGLSILQWFIIEALLGFWYGDVEGCYGLDKHQRA